MRLILPGMGATRAMYRGPWRDLENTRFVDWPLDLDSYRLDDLADWFCSRHPDATVAIGSSLGGMVALLMASKLRLSDVVLIGSAVSYSEVGPFLKKLQPLAPYVPFHFLRYLAGWGPGLSCAMFSRQNPEMIRETILDLPNFHWKGGSVRAHRIHGIHDRIIKCPARADLELNGGHLIAITHPEECCRYLLDHGL